MLGARMTDRLTLEGLQQLIGKLEAERKRCTRSRRSKTVLIDAACLQANRSAPAGVNRT
jgi:hypothetical protein